MTNKTWLITGCATGFGRALAEAALARGDSVVATDRSADAVTDLGTRYPDTALTLGLDVTRPDQVRAALEAGFARFGRIDILVNNAGYGIQAAVEETDEAAMRAMFEVNLFGMIDIIRAALPRLRAQGSGHIVNFASVGGRVSGPLVALYSASKFAVEGLSEGLAAEVAEFGIKVTVVEPGAFATCFGATAVPPHDPVTVYAPLHDSMRKLLVDLPQGDPADLAAAIIEMVDLPEPPLRFVGGADAYAMIEQALERQRMEMEAWRDLSSRANRIALQAV